MIIPLVMSYTCVSHIDDDAMDKFVKKVMARPAHPSDVRQGRIRLCRRMETFSKLVIMSAKSESK